MRTVIFLDIDGVLNCDETQEKCGGFRGIEDGKVSLLKEIVDLVNGEIILSSTWRYGFSKNSPDWARGLSEYLKGKLEKQGLKISGMTPDINCTQRGKEIKLWLDTNGKADKVIILDDEEFDWEGLEDKWICTTDTHTMYPGLSRKHVEYIRENVGQFDYSPGEGPKISTL